MITPDVEFIVFDFGFGSRSACWVHRGVLTCCLLHKGHRICLEVSPDAGRAQGQGYHACQLPPCVPAHVFRSPVWQAKLQWTAFRQPTCSRSKPVALWTQTVWQQLAQVACLHKSAPDDAELCTGSFFAAADGSL